MINKNIEQITKDDLQALIDNEVTEHKTIEYKKVLPGHLVSLIHSAHTGWRGIRFCCFRRCPVR